MPSFDEGTRALGDMIGDGDLVGRVGYPGPYAAVQEIGYWSSGPLAGVHITKYTTPGTGRHYLSQPLMELATEMMQRLADRALEPGGLVSAMRSNVDQLAAVSALRAPKLTGTLAAFVEASVVDNGTTVYERA